MPDRTRKRPNKANALARWDNEGGAPKDAPQEARDDMASLAKEEGHILRCLGAAVIMQWDDLPTDIQRELFEHAVSMGKLNHTAALKGQIARFLHKHKGDESGTSLDLRCHKGHLLEPAQSSRLTFQRGEKAVGPVLDVVV